MAGPFQRFEPHGHGGPRIREIPLRLVLPNLITVLAICAGLSGINGLVIEPGGGGSIVQGLVINRFATNAGIFLNNGTAGAVVRGNFLGTDAAGARSTRKANRGFARIAWMAMRIPSSKLPASARWPAPGFGAAGSGAGTPSPRRPSS